ncbi:hypothetical protein MXB_4896, partial [Myxobolus squamalis]
MSREELSKEDIPTNKTNQSRESLNQFHDINFEDLFVIDPSTKDKDTPNLHKNDKSVKSHSREDLAELNTHDQNDFDSPPSLSTQIPPMTNKIDFLKSQSPCLQVANSDQPSFTASENFNPSQTNSQDTRNSFRPATCNSIDFFTQLTRDTGSHYSSYTPTVEKIEISTKQKMDDLNAVLGSYTVPTSANRYDCSESQSKSQLAFMYSSYKEDKNLVLPDNYIQSDLNPNNEFIYSQEIFSHAKLDVKSMPILSNISSEYKTSFKSTEPQEI